MTKSVQTSSSSGAPPLRHEVGATVTPGDRLGLAVRNTTTLVPGGGTYVRRGHLHASLLGTLCATRRLDDETSAANGEGESWIVSVRPGRPSPSSCSANATAAPPPVGTLVLGRIARVVRPSHAAVDIVAIVPDADDGQRKNRHRGDESKQRPVIIPLHEPFSGTLRQGEIRPMSSLEVRIEDCVRPGDVILARIFANGERDFILTTAEAELGVIRAVCEGSGRVMRAFSWKEMQCPVTKVREGRKVAKPRQTRTA